MSHPALKKDYITTSIMMEPQKAREIILNHKYYVGDTGYYILVRQHANSDFVEDERVCLYHENQMDRDLRGNDLPFDRLIVNEEHAGRSMPNLMNYMRQKIFDLATPNRKGTAWGKERKT